jgi:hypothetical protein
VYSVFCHLFGELAVAVFLEGGGVFVILWLA